MTRKGRLRVLAALVVPILLAFLAVKLAPGHQHGGPPIVIRAEGSDQRLTRSVLTHALEKLFPKGNGTWKLRGSANEDASAPCVKMTPGYRNSTGRAVTAGYLFAGWLGVRLADYVYSNGAAAAAAEGSSAPPGVRAAALCEGRMVANELRRAGYVVGRPRVFPATDVKSGGGRSLRIVIPTRYRGRAVNWDIDSTSLRRGPLVLVVGTTTAEPFQQMNKAFASELLPKSV